MTSLRFAGRASAVALALLLLPHAAAAQRYPWQRLEATGDTSGIVRSLIEDVTVEDGVVTATIQEEHYRGEPITLTMRADLGELNVEAGSARESNRSIHPHLGVVTIRCRGDAACVSYSIDTDIFFELPGPRVFGFFTHDAAAAEQALADLKRIYEGG